MPIELQVNVDPEGLKRIKDAIYNGTDDYIQQLTEDAKDLAFFGKYATGETRQSITNEVEEVKSGVRCRVFTQSGHGGYVEAGTKHMAAEPFLWPAFSRTVNKIFDYLRARMV